MFGRKRKIKHPQFGEMTHARDQWMTVHLIPTAAGLAIVSIEGDGNGPHSDALEFASRTLPRSKDIVSMARIFANAHESAREFLGDNVELELDVLSFRANGEVSVGFGVAGWPDAIVDVKFREGQPYDVWLAD